MAEIIEIYTAAQRTRAFAHCRYLENVLQRLLNSISTEDPYPSMLLKLGAIISQRETQDHAQQLAALTALMLITPDLQAAPDIVFEKLIPLLLALCALPAAGRYQPVANLVSATDYDTLDLALATLSFMRKRGPGGSLIGIIRTYFTQHPEQLELLAHISLECGTLITPVVIPQGEEAYQQYKRAIGQWIELRDSCREQPFAAEHLTACTALHLSLLTCAEEMKYPLTLHLLALLQHVQQSQNSRRESWQEEYLHNRLRKSVYIDYQGMLLFWVLLSHDSAMLLFARDLVLEHYTSQHVPLSTYAQRFLANISRDLRYLRYSRYSRYSRDSSYSRYLRYLRYLRYSRDLSYLSDLRRLLLTKSVAIQAMQHLSKMASVQGGQLAHNCIDSLTILMGRLLQMQENQEIGPDCEQEGGEIIATALLYTGNLYAEEVQDAALDIVCALPLRTANEIVFAFKVAIETTRSTVENACAFAIRRAEPRDKQAWKKLEQEGKAIGIEKIQEVVRDVLKRRKA